MRKVKLAMVTLLVLILAIGCAGPQIVTKRQVVVGYQELGNTLGNVHNQWTQLREKEVVTIDQDQIFKELYGQAYDYYIKAGDKMAQIVKATDSTSIADMQEMYDSLIKKGSEVIGKITALIAQVGG